MKLISVEIRDFRSIFVDGTGQPLRLELGKGANTLVGQNNGGKSNVLRAISLALDPNHAFDPRDDTPGPRPFSYPIITLSFIADEKLPADAAALAAASRFEAACGAEPHQRLASKRVISLEVTFVPVADGYERRESIVTGGHIGDRPADAAARELLIPALAALRESIRFVMIRSGESIESVLEGNFREILHSVVRERLHVEFDTAEKSRQQYIDGLQESLLGPLRKRLRTDVAGLFPEIEDILLAPDVSSIDRTLSNVAVSLDDAVTTPLAGKGTGVRGGLLVAMLSYLASNATRSMVFAVEEPESFLHPAAQEELREQLEAISKASGVTLLVTTHSPFIVTCAAEGRIFNVAKDKEGRTRLADAAPGDADHAPLIGGLLREATLEHLLAASMAVPAGTAAVVLVEGDGDRRCFELAAQVVGRPDLLDGLHLKPTAGAKKLILQSILSRAALDVPVLAVVDNDDAGRSARNALVGSTFNFNGGDVITYGSLFDGPIWGAFPVEAEDVFEPDLIQGFVDHHGQAVFDLMRKRPDDAWHYDFGQASKLILGDWLEAETRPRHVGRWIELLLRLRKRAGLEVGDDTAAAIVAAAGEGVGKIVNHEGTALVVTAPHEHARYMRLSVTLLDPSFQIPEGVTHVAFYARGIQPHVPRIDADHPSLLLSASTAAQLRATERAADERVADVIDAVIAADPDAVDTTRRVLLLTEPEDPATLVLDGVIENTKTINKKPVVWTIGPRTVPVEALAARPSTTTELDAKLAALGDA